MTLEANDLQALKRPFARADHEFITGFVYLTEDAVTNRIDEVDPAWTFEIQRMERVGDQAVVCARLTIKGVSREGVGMYKATGQAGEPDKSAATDALKRCARLFGIGRYLLGAPKEGKAFDRWLDQLSNTSPHWAKNGGGQRFNARMQALGLKPDYVLAFLEADRALQKLSDTTLTEAEALARLEVLADTGGA